MNRIGVRGHDFGRKTIEELAKDISGRGFDAIQFSPKMALVGIEAFEDINEKILVSSREQFAQNDVEISVYGCYVEIGLLDKDRRLEQVEIFRKGITHSKILGAKVIGTETTPLPMDSDVREKAYEGVLDSVLRIVDEAEKQGVDIAIEPVSFHTLNSPELTKRLLDTVKSDRLKIILDSVNLFTVENIKNQREIITNCFELFGDKITSMHIKDIDLIGDRNRDELLLENGTFEWKVIGEGIVDYNHIFSYVKGKDVALLREGATMGSYSNDIDNIRKAIK